ncbi:MAG TPA: AI-2E family transporter [Caulobacteraceae bacterium]|jgi:predicted PurR-regulated permease PerM|nr:AI-2E family transporter [Caulobacteraceae bacterium]
MDGPSQDARFVRRVLIVGSLAVLAYVLVAVAQVLLLAFGAVLSAIVLRAVADPIRRRTPLGRTGSLAGAVVVLALLASLSLWLFGSQAGRQLASLSVTVPAAWAELQARLSGSPLGGRILAELRALDGRTGWLLAWAPRLAGGVASAAASLVIVLFAGLFLAARPDNYLQGVLRLAPVAVRPKLEQALEACGAALRQWLVSQMGSMVLVGTCVGGALWLAGVRSPLALGLLAGIGQFVPLVGPFVVAAPGVLLALADGPDKLVWAVLIYVGVGQFESNLFSPLLLRQMAQLPMALTLFAVLAFGILFGPLGVLFATPLAVVIYVLVKTLYVEGLLEGGSKAP